MDLLTNLETAIALRLEPLKDYGLDVVNSPYRCGGNAKAIAMFYFTDQTGDKVQSCTQNRDITFNLEIKACDPRSHQIAYPFIEAVDTLLHDFCPRVGTTGAIEFRSIRYVPAQTNKGVEWLYDLSYVVQRHRCKIHDVDKAISEIFK